MPARKLLATVIAGALFLPASGFTLGLGEIEVNSALNQKLNAEIELLSATEEDTENLIVKLASRKEFARAGIDRPFLLSDLHFKPVVIDGVPHVKVSSSSPIREPYLNFLVEVDWPNGHLLREYTVLLDPPVFMMQPASTASAPVEQNAEFRPAADSGSANAAPASIAPVVAPGLSARPAAAEQTPPAQAASQVAPTDIPAPAVLQQAVLGQRAGQYRIKAGDTAWSLADAMRPDQSISVEQMMVAMLRANPESFINENVNGLKRGYILRIPDYNQITAISHAEARELVREQAALWRQFTRAQAGGEPVSAMPGEGMAADGEGAEPADNDARLAIVSAGAGSSALGSKDPTQMSAEELRAELALAREAVETEKVEKETLLQRINELEQSVNKMKGMLSLVISTHILAHNIEDNALSEVQALNQPAEGMPVEGEVPEAGGEVIDEQAEQELQEVLGELSEATVTEEGVQVGEEAAEAGTETDAETAGEAVFVDEAESEEAAEEAVIEEAVTEPEPVVQQKQPTPAPVVSRPPQDPLSRIMNDPLLLAGAGGALLLLLVLLGLIVKKRRQAAEAVAETPIKDTGDDLASLADDISSEAEEAVEEIAETEAPVEETADSDFDSDATMILDAEDTIVTEVETGEEETEEARDDVIAEADVYLAYGIYQQAEELLSQAIADNPERDDYRLKLAETYYASKNKDEFIKVAEEMYKRAAGEDTPEWKKVMVMGQDMCADNEMFQGSMVGGLDVDALAPKVPEMDIDLGNEEAAATEATDLDLSLDEPLELPEEQPEEQPGDEEVTTEIVDELEFDISDTGAVVEESAEDEFSLDIEPDELDIDTKDEETGLELEEVDLGIDLDEATTEAGDEIHDVGDVDLDFGLDETEDETETTADETAEEEEEISLDLTAEAEALDLGLDEETGTETAPESAPEEVAGEMDEDDFDLSSLDDVDEISTKLDLARAYLDMGDHEGARGILEEVQADGNDEQKQEAEELMAKLD